MLQKIELLYYNEKLLHTECESVKKGFCYRKVYFLKYSVTTNVNDARRAKRFPGHLRLGFLVNRPFIILFKFVNYFELLQLFRQQFLRQYL